MKTEIKNPKIKQLKFDTDPKTKYKTIKNIPINKNKEYSLNKLHLCIKHRLCTAKNKAENQRWKMTQTKANYEINPVMPGVSQFFKKETQSRILNALRHDLGELIWGALSDPTVTEISVNSDSTIWVDKVGAGRKKIEENLRTDRVLSIITAVASAKGEEIGEHNPSIDALIPGYGYRFVGTLSPLTPSPSFTIRKKPDRIITLDEYVKDGIITNNQKKALTKATKNRETMLIAGGTNSGKTTLANAILQIMAETGHRIITIEDTPELQNPADDQESLYTVAGVRTMQDCLKVALRQHPDRLVFGEVRGAEVRDMLMAWNTGHKGGMCTIHADSAQDSLYRIEEMLETIPNYQPRPRSIARAIDIIVFIEIKPDKTGKPKRIVSEIMRVNGWDEQTGYILESVA